MENVLHLKGLFMTKFWGSDNISSAQVDDMNLQRTTLKKTREIVFTRPVVRKRAKEKNLKNYDQTNI